MGAICSPPPPPPPPPPLAQLLLRVVHRRLGARGGADSRGHRLPGGGRHHQALARRRHRHHHRGGHLVLRRALFHSPSLFSARARAKPILPPLSPSGRRNKCQGGELLNAATPLLPLVSILLFSARAGAKPILQKKLLNAATPLLPLVPPSSSAAIGMMCGAGYPIPAIMLSGAAVGMLLAIGQCAPRPLECKPLSSVPAIMLRNSTSPLPSPPPPPPPPSFLQAGEAQPAGADAALPLSRAAGATCQ